MPPKKRKSAGGQPDTTGKVQRKIQDSIHSSKSEGFDYVKLFESWLPSGGNNIPRSKLKTLVFQHQALQR